MSTKTERATPEEEKREKQENGEENGGHGMPEAVPMALDTSLIRDGRLVIAGLGGIGSFLAPPLAMFVSAQKKLRARMILVDGDVYEDRNRERMEVTELGNKAVVLAGRLSRIFGRPRFYIRPVDQYINEDNVEELIVEKDIVFSCVDNHATRKLLSERCERLDDVVLISGGNDGVEDGSRGTYGNVQIFRRAGGKELNPPLTRFHPEIASPTDEPPSQGCADLAAGTAPQILWTNFFAAAVMGSAFYRLLRPDPEQVMYDEACFDILEAQLLAHSMTN